MGMNIGAGSSHQVSIGSKDCKITKVSLNSIKCITPLGDAMTVADTSLELVEVFVDNWSLQLAGFQYVVDPTFDSIDLDLTFIE